MRHPFPHGHPFPISVTLDNVEVALPQPGQIVAGKYQLVRVLGEGGMGVVYEAEHVRLKQRVALKMLLPELLRVEDLVRRFEREARASSQLRSRHTARVMDVDHTPDGVPYMVMEFLEGRDLDAELQARHALPLDEAVDYVLQAAGAMDEAHGLGIVHRDLKPSNIFIAREHDGRRVAKILDFGISKVSNEGDAKLTSAEAVMGTAMYMAPEQVRSARNVDARADIWSLGVILYELLAGRAPFVGTPTQVVAAIVMDDPEPLESLVQVPPALAAIVSRCLTREPARRFQSVRELMAGLLPFAHADSQGAVTAREALRTQVRVNVTGVSAADPSSPATVADANGKTVPGWTQPGVDSGTSRASIVGFVSVVVAVLLGGFIAWKVVGPKTTETIAPVAATSGIAPPTSAPATASAVVVPPTASPSSTSTTSAPLGTTVSSAVAVTSATQAPVPITKTPPKPSTGKAGSGAPSAQASPTSTPKPAVTNDPMHL